jgi:hypothetical protein
LKFKAQVFGFGCPIEAVWGLRALWSNAPRWFLTNFLKHIEVLPVCQLKSKSYSVKEVYHNRVRPEDARERLRKAVITSPLAA